MKIRVYSTYMVGGITEVELPIGKTMDDIEWIDMKWGKGHIAFKDGTIEEDYFYDDSPDNAGDSFKRPYEISFEDEDCNERRTMEAI
tara:strand:+ start:85 stop:345 length:261 start_codon:yes stop_codon:yes gene_type:complete